MNLLGALEQKAGNLDAALRCLEKAACLAPQNGIYLNNLGNALAGLGKPEEAVQAYETALRFEPRYADAHWNLAETCEQLEKVDQAKRHWRAYLEEDPHSRSAEAVRRHLGEITP